MGAAEQTRPAATYADVLAAPPDQVAELVSGALHLQPRPRMRHSRAAGELFAELRDGFSKDGDDEWLFFIEPEIHLDGNVVVPDIAGWRRENLPDDLDVAYMEVAPDWLCEVLSASTRNFDLTEKRAVYGRAGVRHLWFVDPQSKTLEAFENRDGAWVLLDALGGEAAVALPPFAALSFPLETLWLPER